MVEVIGVGFGRTGTLSLKAALEQLGHGPCHHMDEVLSRRETVADWIAAAEGGAADWDALYRDYRSTVDWPGAFFWRELVAHYPSARVILTVRDPGKWYQSVSSTLFRAGSARPTVANPEATRVMKMMDLIVWDGVFKGRFQDREHALQAFEEHSEAVRREIPADRLLVFDVAQGWGPLCEFLDVPVPAGEFPRLNDQETYAAKHRARLAAAMNRGAPPA
ncbi:hypothetical protein BBK14_14475 [Parafrankia soli]|uniref:Sulfotransferase family protein n=1 Tax=Parafrankia soli TaxID=2599596 RepID=A0A1S1QT58_9ACTN|nr:sulfotransferase family protein [Parafrankia soli]OHV36776.1 hypothetical protein BBK14_14475 [Parafrankia soli]